MPSVLLNCGASFQSDPGESLLDAAFRADVLIAYGCRTGRCGSCKCKVIRGESRALSVESGLSDREKAEGWILSCVRTPTTDLRVQVEDFGDLVVPQARILPCRIHSLEKLAPDVLQVILRIPPSSELSFLPGQYIEVMGPGGIRRSYSLANADATAKLLELHIRAVQGGLMSEYWFNQAKVNDLLRLNGPLGTFFVRNVANLDLIFLATGTGIAPVKAMLENVETFPIGHKPRSISVYWGGRVLSDLYWDVASAIGNGRYVPVLSRAPDDWSGVRGHVQQALLSNHPDLAETAIYACGSDAMIRSAKELLIGAGLPAERFLSDAFVCSSTF